MSSHSLKSKATTGFLWNAAERFSVTAGQFIIGIVLARLLMPEDFGLIGMLSIFIALSQVFISSGMASGLIQKQNRTDQDYSTVFIFNLVVSVVCYGLLYITAPLIAGFYEMPALISLTRVLGISLIINAMAVVQRTKLEIDVDFKTLAKVNVVALLTGGGACNFCCSLWPWRLVTCHTNARNFNNDGYWPLAYWKLEVVVCVLKNVI